jgi:hypothetical protein
MFLTVRSTQFDSNYIIINNKTKNNIMNNSDFYRILYSDENVSINGIFIHFVLKSISIEKYFNKVKCCFHNSLENNKTMRQLLNIERTTLDKISSDMPNYKAVYRMKEQLHNNFIKIYNENHIKLGNHTEIIFMLKISGIWSSEQSKTYGITFRFYII